MKSISWSWGRVVMGMAGIAAIALFLPGSSCKRTINPNDVITTRDIVRFLIRTTPDYFSNSFLDTTSFALSGTNISFSRNYTVKNIDTFIVLNDLDTVGNQVQPKFPVEAGADVVDTLIGTLRINKADTIRNRLFRMPVRKFGYFLKLDSDAQVNRGWVIWSVTQTFAGRDFASGGLLVSVRLTVKQPGRDTLIVRSLRTQNPETDPQLLPVLSNPYQLKPGDTVEVSVQGPDTSDFVICHIRDGSSFRRVQLNPDSTGAFIGMVVVASSPQFGFQRLTIDALSNFTLNDPIANVRNEIWGILYQIKP